MSQNNLIESTSLAPDLLRKKTVETVKRHKASWIELGQYLYTVHQNKYFRDWGYLSFETYCGKELRLKMTTASRLLKSYHFLEREEPQVVRQATQDPGHDEASAAPDYEAVNLLRLARENKNISPQDFAQLREAVIEKGEEVKGVRDKVKRILHEQVDPDSDAVKRSRRNAQIKRAISVLKTTKAEMQQENTLPKFLMKQIDELIEKLQDQVED